MTFSMGPFLMCMMAILFLVVYLYIVLKYMNGILYSGIKMVFVGLVLILFRMIFPINFPFTKNILSEKILPPFATIIYKDLGTTSWEVGEVLLVIWIVGAIYKLLLFLKKYVELKRDLSVILVTDEEKERVFQGVLTQEEMKKIGLAYVKRNISPAILGIIKPILILPSTEFSKQELHYIIRHEIEHYRNYDLWIKFLMEIVLCIHWWNPFVYLLQKKLNLVLEISNDVVVMQNMNAMEKTDYAECIFKVAQGSVFQKEKTVLPFVGKNKSNLKSRIHFITKDYRSNKLLKKVSLVLHMSIITIVMFITLFFVPEASYTPKEIEEETVEITPENAYFIKKEGGYEIYVDGKYFGDVPDITGIEEHEKITVYEEGEGIKEKNTNKHKR